MLWRAPQAPVAQLDRVSVFETEGWEFKPLRARQPFPLEIIALPALAGVFVACPATQDCYAPMVLKMARPVARKGTANAAFRQRIPADIKRILASLPRHYRPNGWGKDEIVISLRTADPKAISAAHAKIMGEVERHYAGLRAGFRSLSNKEAVALAGEVYRDFRQFEDDPGDPAMWRSILEQNRDAQAGNFGLQLGIGDEARLLHAMEYRFGALVDHCLPRHAILTDADSRWKLVRALADAMNDAALKLAKNAGGDYRPDANADRFPEWKPPVQPSASASESAKSGPTVAQLFKAWRSHALRLNAKPNTLDRYAPCLRSLDEWAAGRPAGGWSRMWRAMWRSGVSLGLWITQAKRPATRALL
jgi:hypothetical protein